MMPGSARKALHASTILRESLKARRARCVDGITANRARARELLERSTATATALSPYIGYAATAELAKESIETGRPIRELVLERGLLDRDRLEDILSPGAMTRGGVVGSADGITGNRARARELLERSTATATALSPYIGYAATAELAKESIETGRPIRELVLERGLLDRDRLEDILSPGAMTRGGVVGSASAKDDKR